MTTLRRYSAQTLLVFAELLGNSAAWRHGYELAKETGLKSGTLYPILIRLSDRGLVAAKWEDDQPAGRPRRHLYRLTANGVAQAGEALASGVPNVAAIGSSPDRSGTPSDSPRRNRLAAEGA